MITRLAFKNFTAFKELTIEFSPKINVIIGENGTGKTHLLKAAYAVCSGNGTPSGDEEADNEAIIGRLTEKLLRLFLPMDDKLWKLRSDGASEPAKVDASFALDKAVGLSFNTNSKSIAITKNVGYSRYSWEPVFIPTKEVLSFMKGFVSLYDRYELSFDQSYRDLCGVLELAEVRSESMHEKSRWAMGEIARVCGGRFVFQGSGKVIFKSEAAEHSANEMAEGFRKLGILARLLETGVISPGVSGPLFWDEPEANLNPKLLKLLVEVLLELSRNGQQVILATHDYVFLKWFDLLADAGKEDQVRFHTLHRGRSDGSVAINSTNNYLDIQPNPIDEAYGNLIDREIDDEMGELGK